MATTWPLRLEPTATADFVDVINKYALLRLHDADHDGFVERTESIASGWGHTKDYHDWAIGLPMDAEGNYYISTACQQDERDPAAAILRGKVIQLRPRTPDVNDPRLFENHRISGGHRFPIGIARNRSGQLFVSDNQGNYNPFNELNHVRQDIRFGFINKLELSDSFKPPLTEASIKIPHPWTRMRDKMFSVVQRVDIKKMDDPAMTWLKAEMIPALIRELHSEEIRDIIFADFAIEFTDPENG